MPRGAVANEILVFANCSMLIGEDFSPDTVSFGHNSPSLGLAVCLDSGISVTLIPSRKLRFEFPTQHARLCMLHR